MHVPGRRAASAGRVRSHALPLRLENTDGSDDFESGSISPHATGGFRPSRPLTAMGSRVVSHSTAAWGVGAGDESPGASGKRVHVQALAGAKGREQLAEDVVALRETVSALRERLGVQKVEKRRVEQELSRTRQALMKSEELLNNKERLTSPTTGMSQLYRSPDTTHLVASLKQQVSEQRSVTTRLEAELRALQKSTRATRVAELQSEVFAMGQELDRLSRLAHVATQRATEAEASALAAKVDATQARLALQQHQAESARQEYEAAEAADEVPRGGGSGSLRRTLQAMHQAHKVLMHEAEQLRAIFPPGLSMADFTKRARSAPNTAGAPDVLNFLRNHAAKLSSELTGQPGAPLASRTDTGLRSVLGPAPQPLPPAAPPLVGSTPPDPLQIIADGVRRLRTLSPTQWRENPTLKVASEQMHDIMVLYVEEVHRLQGKAAGIDKPAAAPASSEQALQSSRAVTVAELEALQRQLRESQAALADAQAAAASAKAAANGEAQGLRQQLEALARKDVDWTKQHAELAQQVQDARDEAAAARAARAAAETTTAAWPAAGAMPPGPEPVPTGAAPAPSNAAKATEPMHADSLP